MIRKIKDRQRMSLCRPTTGKGAQAVVRFQLDALAWLDAEREKFDPPPSRREMVRRILAM